jgi:hypothetical protein
MTEAERADDGEDGAFRSGKRTNLLASLGSFSGCDFHCKRSTTAPNLSLAEMAAAIIARFGMRAMQEWRIRPKW